MSARRSFKTGSPLEVPAVRGWIDLSASSQSGGEWTNFLDVKNNNEGSINAARRPAVAASNNGYPIASFATNDCVSFPLNVAINSQRTRVGWAAWVKVGNLAGFNTLYSISTGTLGASAARQQLLLDSTESIVLDTYMDASLNGRRFVSTSPLAQNTWTFLRFAYDSGLGGDANLSVFVNEVLITGTFSNLNSGATLAVLPAVTGKLLVGNINDGSASAALNGFIGPDQFFIQETVRAAEGLRLMNYRIPT